MYAPRAVTVLMTVGSLLVVLGAVFIGVFPVIFTSIVSKMLVLREGGGANLEAFISPPVPIYLQFFLFNVTNPDAIRYHGAKPVLQQVGPYTYREQWLKEITNWNDTEGTLTYKQNKTYFFEPSLSPGLSEDDQLTTINTIMVLAADLFSKVDDAALKLVIQVIWSEFEKGFDLFETHSLGELMFEGADLPEFNFDFSNLHIPGLPDLSFTDGLNGTLYDILVKLGLDPPQGLEENKFGFLHGLNNTNDGTYTIKTGVAGMDDFQEIVRWNGSPTLDYWHGDEYCNMINGTDGSMFPPGVTRHHTLYIYTSQLCRSMYLKFEKKHKHYGIPVYRFVPPRSMLEDPLINHDNLCYCTPDTDHCLGAGMLDMSPCAAGAPLVMSTPHFYQGDDAERDKLVGLNPQKTEHETFLDIEPKTGVTMNAAKKIQLNVPLKPYGRFPSFRNVPEVTFPILWINESAGVDEVMAGDVRKGVSLPFVVVDAICGLLIAVGVVLLLTATAKFLRFRRSHSQRKY